MTFRLTKEQGAHPRQRDELVTRPKRSCEGEETRGAKIQQKWGSRKDVSEEGQPRQEKGSVLYWMPGRQEGHGGFLAGANAI